MPTYSFNDVTGSLVGPTGSTPLGYGEAVTDEGISIEPKGDKNTMEIAADGNGQHSLHADNSGIVTIRCLKTSPLNAVLQAMYDVQTSSSALHGQNLITVAHAPSGDMNTAEQCAFSKKPRVVYGKVAGLMEWMFESIKVHSVLGTY